MLLQFMCQKNTVRTLLLLMILAGVEKGVGIIRLAVGQATAS